MLALQTSPTRHVVSAHPITTTEAPLPWSATMLLAIMYRGCPVHLLPLLLQDIADFDSAILGMDLTAMRTGVQGSWAGCYHARTLLQLSRSLGCKRRTLNKH